MIAAGPDATRAQAPTGELDAVLEAMRAQEGDVSDDVLVRRATELLTLRANTKISFKSYARGVRYFKENHPAFYGAFFGDPFFAEYDVRYFDLVDRRRTINVDVNPTNSIFNSSWLFCHPYGYDPAFNGTCRGFAYPADEFFLLPTWIAFAGDSGHEELASVPRYLRDANRINGNAQGPVVQNPPSAVASTAPSRDTPRDVAPVRSVEQILADADLDRIDVSQTDVQVPPLMRAVDTPEQWQDIQRLRTLVRQQNRGLRLSAAERAEMMAHLRTFTRVVDRSDRSFDAERIRQTLSDVRRTRMSEGYRADHDNRRTWSNRRIREHTRNATPSRASRGSNDNTSSGERARRNNGSD